MMTRKLFGLALLAASLADCAGARGSRPGSQPVVKTTITVDNQTFNDLNVFVVNGSQRIRLGQVASHQKLELTIPATVVGNSRELTFLAEPITRRGGAITNAIWVAPGDHVSLIVPP